MSAPRVVLFDLDGTLVDTRAIYAVAYRSAFALLETPPTFEDLIKRRPSAERHLLVDWYGEAEGDRLHQQVVETYRALAAEHLTAFYAGIEAVIVRLRERGITLGVVTGKSRGAQDATEAQLDFGAFATVVVEDDVPEPKPDPAGIRLALERLGASAEGAVYVGDTPMDLEASWAAGLQPALALWGRKPGTRARIDGSVLGGGPPDPPLNPLEMALSEMLARTDVSAPAWILEEPWDLIRQMDLGER